MIAGFISFVRLVGFSSRVSVYCVTDCNSLFALSTWKVETIFESQRFSRCPSWCIFTSGSLSFCLSYNVFIFIILPTFYHDIYLLHASFNFIKWKYDSNNSNRGEFCRSG